MSVQAVLLIPAAGDPHGLLREGPCGARPPMVYEGWEGDPLRSWWTTASATANASARFYPSRAHRRALVLAWDGEPVAEGLGRLRRAGKGWPWAEPHWHVKRTLGGVHGAVSRLRSLVAANDAGTIVLLDADGREVSGE